MFQLDHEIKSWCASVVLSRYGNRTRMAELEDHLYCEINALAEQGIAEQEAFLIATKKMGNSDDLSTEYAKNHGLLLTLFGNKKGELETDKKPAIKPIIHALIFAALMIISALLMSGSEYKDTVTNSLILIWWISFSITHRTMKTDCAYFRRLIRIAKKD